MSRRVPSRRPPTIGAEVVARVLLYASAKLFGESLGACLRQDDSIEEVHVLHDIVELPHTTRQAHIDVVLFDVTSGQPLGAVRALTDELSDTPVVALAVSPDAHAVIACADAGFVGWVPRDASLDELVGIVRMAMRGETDCDPKLTRSLLEELRRRRDPRAFLEPDAQLTRRETETLRLMSLGLTNKEIAGELHLSVATVKNHVHAVLGKLQLKRRSEARRLLHEKPWLLRSA